MKTLLKFLKYRVHFLLTIYKFTRGDKYEEGSPICFFMKLNIFCRCAAKLFLKISTEMCL